jgi:hypothetical protein
MDVYKFCAWFGAYYIFTHLIDKKSHSTPFSFYRLSLILGLGHRYRIICSPIKTGSNCLTEIVWMLLATKDVNLHNLKHR